MNSKINNQIATVNTVVVPSGVNIASNSSPSLPPTNGSLALDVSKPGVLYVGNSSTWLNSAQSANGLEGESFAVGFNMGLAANPNLVGVIAKIVIAQSPQGVAMATLELLINQTVTAASAGNYTSIVVIPSAFRPPQDLMFPMIETIATVPTQSYFKVAADGHFEVTSIAVAGSNQFYSGSCSYSVPPPLMSDETPMIDDEVAEFFNHAV